MLTVLGGLAEFERHLILARTSDGSERARARGVRFGRKLKLTMREQHSRHFVYRGATGSATSEPGHEFHPKSSVLSLSIGDDRLGARR